MKTFEQMTDYAFSGVTITDYLASGGDINIMKDGEYWIEHIFSDESFTIFTQLEEANFLLAHPDLKIDSMRMQTILYKHIGYLDNHICQFDSEQKNNLINQFLIEQPLLFKNTDNHLLQEVILETKFWLHEFLNNYFSSDYFLLAHEYHPDFMKAIKLKDTQEDNIWHSFIKYIMNTKTDIYFWSRIEKICGILFSHYPEGLHHKNKMNLDIKGLFEIYDQTDMSLVDSQDTVCFLKLCLEKLQFKKDLENGLKPKSNLGYKIKL